MRASTIEVRRESLKTVLDWYGDQAPAPTWQQMLDCAEATAEYLTTPWAMRIRIGLVTDQETGKPIHPQPQGAKVQLTDTQQVTYTITALDAKGYEVSGEDFSASIDNPDIASIDDQGNTFQVVAGIPGSAIITFTDGTLTATEALDVVPGDVATIRVEAGDPTEQSEAAPPDSTGGDTGTGGDVTGGDITGGDTGGDVAPPVDVPPDTTGDPGTGDPGTGDTGDQPQINPLG